MLKDTLSLEWQFILLEVVKCSSMNGLQPNFKDAFIGLHCTSSSICDLPWRWGGSAACS